MTNLCKSTKSSESDKKQNAVDGKEYTRGQYNDKMMLGSKPPTMMPTDCFVLRTPTILPAIRISWCLRPTFMLISGRVSRSFYHQCASTRGFRPFEPDIIKMMAGSTDPNYDMNISSISEPKSSNHEEIIP